MFATGKFTVQVKLRRAATSVVLAALVGASLAGTSQGYTVTPGSKGNVVHMSVDDRVGLTTGVRLSAEVLESPAWLTIQQSDFQTDRLIDLALTFDVADVPPATKGHMKVRLSGTDASGNTTFDRSHYISLITQQRVEPIQESFTILECCLTAAGIDNPSVAPATHTLVGAVPNPFSSVTNIVFGLPVAGGHVQLQVFNLEGRLIRTMETPRLNGGFHRITWDGRSDDGLDVSPGTYFCRLSSGSWTSTTKAQFLR